MRGRSVLLVVALLAACSDSSDKDATSPSSTSAPPQAQATAELVPSVCPFDPPATDHWECSTLIVPADRAHPEGGHMLLPVAVLRSQAPDRLPDPIVYFNGGPGDDTLTNVAGFFGEQLRGGRRDAIIFDQRGTGGARPSLNCPELEMSMRENLGAADSDAVEADREERAARACRARLVDSGVDLDDFDTPTTADDAEDLRRALGVDSWNVIGVSYGTTVVLEVLRRHPESVRSAVVDSVFPPDISQAGGRVVRAAARAFTTFFEGCAHSPTCAASHADLRADFNSLADSWDREPFELDVDDPRGGDAKIHVRLTGADLTGGLHQALYRTDLIAVLPSVSTQVRARDDAARALVATFVGDALQQSLGTSEAVEQVVNCADRQRVDDDPGDVEVLIAPTPSLRTFLGAYSDCDLWDVASVPPAFNTIPASKVRLLALAGEYDPITPPEDTERAATRFAGSTYVLFPGHGHGEIFSDDCPRTVLWSFIDDPTAAPDMSCVEEMGPPEFAEG